MTDKNKPVNPPVTSLGDLKKDEEPKLTTPTPPPVVPTPPVPPPTVVPSAAKVDAIVDKNKKEKDARKTELLELMGDTIKEYNGEGNIPIDHEYWHARNEYRRLNQP